MLGANENWERWLWVELNIDLDGGDGDVPGVIVVDYD